VCYQRQENEDKGEVVFKGLGGFIHYKLLIPTLDFKNVSTGVKVESEQESGTKKDKEETFISMENIHYWYENYEELLLRIRSLQETVRSFMSHVHCEKWVWKTIVGTGDAAEAGVITGVVWGVKANILGFISHSIQWDDKPSLEVTPSFQKAILHTFFESRFSFSIWHAIRLFFLLRFGSRKHSRLHPVRSGQKTTSNL
jgi:hypothetical protein